VVRLAAQREGIGSRVEGRPRRRGDGAHAAELVRVITTPDSGLCQIVDVFFDRHIFYGEHSMTTKLATALAMMALLGGCQKRDTDTGALDKDRAGVDTSIQTNSVKDTTVVKADTNIDVDTLKKTDNTKNDSTKE
jgi:hypothetical protein